MYKLNNARSENLTILYLIQVLLVRVKVAVIKQVELKYLILESTSLSLLAQIKLTHYTKFIFGFQMYRHGQQDLLSSLYLAVLITSGHQYN